MTMSVNKDENFIIGQYVERNDVKGLAEYFRAYITDEMMDKRKLPSERIEELAREMLDEEKEKGMILFPKGIHEEKLIEAILEYLDEQYEQR